MTDVVLTVQRIEPGKTDRLREWASELEAREDEVVETLENEDTDTESAFLRSTDDGNFLVYYMEVADIEAAKAAVAGSEHEIDREHREVMRDVLIGMPDDSAELLFHFVNADRPTGFG